MKSAIILVSMLLALSACSTPQNLKEDLTTPNSETTSKLDAKVLQAFHLKFSKECDAVFTAHNPPVDVTKIKVFAADGWMTIDGHPIPASCYNVIGYKFFGSPSSRVDDETLGRLALGIMTKVSNRIIERYFMGLYPERFTLITSEEAQAHYDANKTTFQRPDEMALKVIVVDANDPQIIKNGKTPLQIITDIEVELKSDFSRFDVFMEKYSKNPPQNKKLLNVHMFMIHDSYYEQLKVNETSKPVEMEGIGYAIVHKYVVKKSYMPSIEELEPQIKKDLFEIKRKKALQEIRVQHKMLLVPSKIQPALKGDESPREL